MTFRTLLLIVLVLLIRTLYQLSLRSADAAAQYQLSLRSTDAAAQYQLSLRSADAVLPRDGHIPLSKP
ncbi:hypothetical protein EBZ37_11680 [bacterium]|nr:hypothetical protein [bacterium]